MDQEIKTKEGKGNSKIKITCLFSRLQSQQVKCLSLLTILSSKRS